MRKILLLLVVMALALVPGVTAFEYFIEYGPYSTNDYGPYEAGWHGPVYDASPLYPLTDYEIDIDMDFSGNNDYFNKMGKIIITGYSGDNEIWSISVADSESGARRLYIACFVGDERIVNYGPIYGDWSGPLKFVHSTPDNWEFWVNGNLVKSLTKPDIGPLTTITVELLRYDGSTYRIIPGMSCDRIAIYGVVDDSALPDQPCTIYVYDADTRLPLAGDWEYYIVVEGSDAVSGSASGASTVVFLPETSILQPHLLRVTKEGYEQIAPLAFDVPAGGREVKVYLSPLETTAPEGSSVVTFAVTDIETGTPLSYCLVNVDGEGKYTGASGTAWFVLPDNTTHQWVVTAEGYWPIGGNFTVGVDDLTIPVEMTKKDSDLPRPPLPDLPNFPVMHPSLDPAGFRMHILSVPYLGDMAEPLLDTVDNLAAGVNDIAFAVLDVLTAPADSIVLAVKGISSQLVEVSEAYLSTGVFVLDSLGMLLAAIPSKVINLVTFAMVLDIIVLLLRGGL